MFATVIAAMLMQSATAQMVEQNYESRDVAYEQIVAGQIEEAIARLEAALEDNPGEPAILINLGSAHARAGNWDRAEHYYRLARDSEETYEVELADGTWMSSDDAARLALATVEFEALAGR